jgi:glutathione peroxidase
MTTAHEFSFTSIEGKPLPMKNFKGRPVLLVNTASACGFTPQYKGLQQLWTAQKNKGLVVLGVPSNDFGAQEPGTEQEISAFCETRFGVDFPLTAKVHVIGPEAHPLYKWIAAQLGEGAAPKWNFTKYLLGKEGAILETFGPRTDPLAPEVTKAIDAAL